MTTKEKILYQTMELFARKGYDGVSTRMIASEVGISDSGLYKHYAGKEDLLNTILEKGARDYEQVLAPVYKNSGTAAECVASVFSAFRDNQQIASYRKLLLSGRFGRSEMAELYDRDFLKKPVEAFAYLIGGENGKAQAKALECISLILACVDMAPDDGRKNFETVLADILNIDRVPNSAVGSAEEKTVEEKTVEGKTVEGKIVEGKPTERKTIAIVPAHQKSDQKIPSPKMPDKGTPAKKDKDKKKALKKAQKAEKAQKKAAKKAAREAAGNAEENVAGKMTGKTVGKVAVKAGRKLKDDKK